MRNSCASASTHGIVFRLTKYSKLTEMNLVPANDTHDIIKYAENSTSGR